MKPIYPAASLNSGQETRTFPKTVSISIYAWLLVMCEVLMIFVLPGI